MRSLEVPRAGPARSSITTAESNEIELADQISTSPSSRSGEHGPVEWEELTPIPTPAGYKKLNAKPQILEKAILITLAVYNGLCLGAILAVYLRSGADLRYFTSDSNVRLFVSWAPSILGTTTTVAVRSVMFAFARLDPYIAMADASYDKVDAWENGGGRTVGAQYLPPGVIQIPWAIQVRNWLRLHLSVHTFVMGFVTGLKSVFLTIEAGQGGWYIVVAPTTSKILALLYSINQSVLLHLIFYLWNRPTGLKWDPTTIADQLALFHDSNVLADFDLIEREKEFSAWQLRENKYRIGYWNLTRGNATQVVYGIRRAGRRIYVPPNQTPCNEKQHRAFCQCRQQPYFSVHSRGPYSRTPIFSRWWLLWWMVVILAAFAGCIIAIVKNVPKTGFVINYSSRQSQLIYTYGIRFPAVFMASWISTGHFPNIDLDLRYTQPFANMYKKDASVSDTLLLNYLWGLPGLVTFTALTNKHWKVALCSAVTLAAPAFPVLVANFFTPVVTPSDIQFKGGETVFYAVFVFLIVYFVTLVAAYPMKNRRLPRWCPSIADLMSFFYASKVMTSGVFDLSDANVSKTHLEARLFLEEGRFEAGVFTGSDGARHFGVDYKYIDGNAIAHVLEVSSQEGR